MLPLPPPDVERNAPALAEFESVTRQIRASCHQVALLDRVHNIKVRAVPTPLSLPRQFNVDGVHMLQEVRTPRPFCQGWCQTVWGVR